MQKPIIIFRGSTQHAILNALKSSGGDAALRDVVKCLGEDFSLNGIYTQVRTLATRGAIRRYRSEDGSVRISLCGGEE